MTLLPRSILLRPDARHTKTFAYGQNSSIMASVSLSITHPPKHGQFIRDNDLEYETVQEGSAYVLIPKSTSTLAKASKATEGKEKREDGNGHKQTVFYNPIQQFNRDLSVLAIKAYGEDATRVKRDLWTKRREIIEEKRVGKKRKRAGIDGDKAQKVGGGNAVAGKAARELNGKRDNNLTGPTVQATNEKNGTDLEIEGNENKKRKRTDDEGTSEGFDGMDFGGIADIEYKGKRRKISGSEEALRGLTGEVEPTTTARGDQSQAPPLNEATEVPEQSVTIDLLKDTPMADRDISGHETPTETENKSSKPNETSKPLHSSFTVLDALSATGLRALRYAKELPFITSVLANDMSPKASRLIELNVRHNKVNSTVSVNTGDARELLYAVSGSQKVQVPEKSGFLFGKFDVIDLDPYGTAAPFFDGAVQAVTDGGLLCVTCTDAGVFASSGYPEKTYSLYGGLPLRGPQSHEGGLRLILNAIASSAARYGCSIEPLLSLSIDYYARLFVRVHRSAAQTKFLAGKTMMIYSCDNGCGAWTTQLLGRNHEQEAKNGTKWWKYSQAQGPSSRPNCEHCGFVTHVAGPMWAGPLHSPHFIQSILDILPTVDKKTYPTTSRIEGMLSTALEEDLDLQGAETSAYPPPIGPLNAARVDRHPFFIVTGVLAKVIHSQTPDDDSFRGALRHLGYRVTRSHTKAGSIKTDAPWNVIWEVMREWARQKSPLKADAIKEGTAGWAVMAKGREISGHDRLGSMKAQLLAAMEKAKDVEMLKTEVEAAMYRASREMTNGQTSNGTEVDMEEDKPKKLVIPPSKLKVVFDKALGAENKAKKLVRYQMNPRADWGPMHRAAKGLSK
jgi:tRNA (guanine26-N2/guanine27-N2)-dimethyltransferase